MNDKIRSQIEFWFTATTIPIGIAIIHANSMLAADKMMASTCYGACASVWPPLAVIGTPKAGPGVQASLLGTTKRTNGSAEVTYNGHPLYHYAGDTPPGATNGQNIDEFGALWHVLSANGNEVGHG